MHRPSHEMREGCGQGAGAGGSCLSLGVSGRLHVFLRGSEGWGESLPPCCASASIGIMCVPPPLPFPAAVGEGGGTEGEGGLGYLEAQPAQPTSPLQAQGPSTLFLMANHALPSSPSVQLGPRGPGHSGHRTCHHWVGLMSREVAPQGCIGRGQGSLAVIQGAVEQGQRVEALGNKEKSEHRGPWQPAYLETPKPDLPLPLMRPWDSKPAGGMKAWLRTGLLPRPPTRSGPTKNRLQGGALCPWPGPQCFTLFISLFPLRIGNAGTGRPRSLSHSPVGQSQGRKPRGLSSRCSQTLP